MFDILFKEKAYKFMAIVNVDDRTFYISSTDTFDAGYELMVFELKNAPKIEDNFVKRFNYCQIDVSQNSFFNDSNVFQYVDWADLYDAHYTTVEEAEEDFDRLLNPNELRKALKERGDFE